MANASANALVSNGTKVTTSTQPRKSEHIGGSRLLQANSIFLAACKIGELKGDTSFQENK